MKSLVFSLLIALVVLAFGTEANAQQRKPSYQPAKPTLSPYLFLTRPQVGYFPNYHTFVEPMRNQTRVNQIQQTQITGLNQQVQEQQQLQKSLQRPAAAAPTGHGSVYGNVSHYYSSGPASGGNRQGRPSR